MSNKCSAGLLVLLLSLITNVSKIISNGKCALRQCSLHIQTWWLSPTPTSDSLFQWNKPVDADGTGPLWRTRQEILANRWQKQLRMCLGTHFPVYWTVLSSYAPPPKVARPIFTSTQPFHLLEKCWFLPKCAQLCSTFSALAACMQAQRQQHTRVFVFSPRQTGSDLTLTARVRSVQTPDQTEHWERPTSADSCPQVRSFGLVHVASIHIPESLWRKSASSFADCDSGISPFHPSSAAEMLIHDQQLGQRWLKSHFPSEEST